MKFNTNKILAEWAYRVDDGQPDVTNVDHVNHLREVLYNFGLPHKFIVEYVHGLTEANKAGQTWQTKSGKWAGWKAGEKRAQYGMKTGKEAQAYVAGKTTATSTDSKGKDKKPEKKYPKTAQDKQWTGDTPDNIADKVSLSLPSISGSYPSMILYFTWIISIASGRAGMKQSDCEKPSIPSPMQTKISLSSNWKISDGPISAREAPEKTKLIMN